MSVDCHACIGGTSVRGDMTALQAGPQVVVGTPGRMTLMLQTAKIDFLICSVFGGQPNNSKTALKGCE